MDGYIIYFFPLFSKKALSIFWAASELLECGDFVKGIPLLMDCADVGALIERDG